MIEIQKKLRRKIYQKADEHFKNLQNSVKVDALSGSDKKL